MSIQASARAEIKQMIEALGGADEVKREAAIARLAVIGPRAVEHLLRGFSSAPERTRAGILRALEASADPRALPVARAALTDASTAVQAAGIGAARALLDSEKAGIAGDALDALVAVALDTARPAAIRVAAFDALRDAAADLREPVRTALAQDDDAEVRARVSAATAAPPDDDQAWREAVGGHLPPSPATLKRALAVRRGSARLTELQHLIDHIRAREQREPDPGRRQEWRAVRGAMHQALAARNSRLALYDLRDSLMDADPLPVAFLAAIEEIGDGSCLETLAAAYDASSRSGDTWWREHVASAFRAIVQREGLTRRHAAVKRTLARWPEAAAELMARI